MTAKSSRPTVLHVVGARPNFMKVAPLLRALDAGGRWRSVLVHTGQHYDDAMSDAFFRELDIRPPDRNLGVGSGTHAEQTGQVMIALEPLILEEAPDLVVVVGDVNSTLAAALTAAKLHVPVAHVEAGLRSGDRSMPEEINRVLTDQLSDLLLTTSRGAGENLEREGIPRERIHFVGNVMIDTLLRLEERARALDACAQRGLEAGSYALVTLHRPRNVDSPEQLEKIMAALGNIAGEMPVLFPAHPRTRERLTEFGIEVTPGVVLADPVGYLEMISLQATAAVVLTDSGGIQEETTVLGVPCLTLRPSTERPVTLEQGTNRLVPEATTEAIVAAFRRARLKPPSGDRRPELWDGGASERIVRVLEAWWEGRGEAPEGA